MGVIVDVKVIVGVLVGVLVLVDVSVIVGPKSLPGPQVDVIMLIMIIIKIYEKRFILFPINIFDYQFGSNELITYEIPRRNKFAIIFAQTG